jgi:uncharacterized protein (DUF2147 family)
MTAMARTAFIAAAVVFLAACGGSTTGPTSASIQANIAGTWTGTIASSNNGTMQYRMVLTQSSAAVSGTWDSSSVSWQGNVTGTISGSSFTGQLTFSGTVSDGTVCTGTASVSGTTSSSSMTWTSDTGVVSSTACPAALPVGIKINVQKQ